MLFIISLKTKKMVRSAVSGKINYYAKIYVPFVVGFLIIAWAMFAFLRQDILSILKINKPKYQYELANTT